MDSTYEIIKELIDFNSEGVDTYNHNGSTWLIFTDEKKWVIELTKEKTLWYNYYFFTCVFKYLSLDVVENQHYITKWVEDEIINKKPSQIGVMGSHHQQHSVLDKVEDTIQNGVNDTFPFGMHRDKPVEDTIQNGVKQTEYGDWLDGDERLDDIIENGVKKTKKGILVQELSFEGVIQNGVKLTQGCIFDNPTAVKDTIKNGIKETHRFGLGNENEVEDTIQNGVKVTYSDKIPREYDWSDQFTEEIDDIIQNGVKGTTPGGYLGSLEMNGKTIHQFETAKQLYYVEDVIESGIKKTEGGVLFDESKIDKVIIEGVKEIKKGGFNQHYEMFGAIEHGIKETHDDVMPHTGRVEGVIKNGVKVCAPSHIPVYNPMDFSVVYRENHRIDDVASVLEKGIKEVQPLPSQEGNMDWGNYYHRQENRTKPHTQYVNDVITNGIKETKPMDEWVNTERILDNVIDKGIKETKSSGSDFPKWADDAMLNGTKNPTF